MSVECLTRTVCPVENLRRRLRHLLGIPRQRPQYRRNAAWRTGPRGEDEITSMFEELDVVTLTHDIPEHSLSKDSRGTVVHCYADRQAFEVEFGAESGETLALLTLEKGEIQAYFPESVNPR